MNQHLRAFTAVLLSVGFSACGATGMFSDGDTEQPAELVEFEPEFELTRQWRTRVGDGQGGLYRLLRPAIDDDTIYAAAADGTVMAIDKNSGELVWERQLEDETITGGTGVGGGRVLLGTRDAEVIALDQSSGEELWRSPVTSEVLAPPRGNGDLVAVQTVDSNLIALEADSGERRWIYESTVPSLTLRGTSSPLLTGNRVIAGFSNGMLAAVNAGDGTLAWEQRVAVPEGSYELERVVDIDGELLLSGNVVYVTSYQGNLMGLDTSSGRIVWGREGSSHNGMATGLGNLYYTNDESHLFAAARNEDTTIWENERMRLRRLSAPTALRNYVAVGDYEGYVHLVSQLDGSFVSRYEVGGNGIRAPIQEDNGTLYVYANNGRLSALNLP